jgi:hypothetical protein
VRLSAEKSTQSQIIPKFWVSSGAVGALASLQQRDHQPYCRSEHRRRGNPAEDVHRTSVDHLPMIFGLLVIRMTSNIRNGVETPCTIPAKTKAFIGLMPKKFNQIARENNVNKS